MITSMPARCAWLALLLPLLLLGACARKQVRAPVEERAASAAAGAPATRADQAPAAAGGGLYAPHIRDGAPVDAPDIASLMEPTPRREPRARYGNHSPYTVLGREYRVMDDARGYVERGVASWYGTKFHGRATSTLEPYDMYAFTAAHKTLPLPTYASVTNLENGRSVIVRINDRGPFAHDRLIDLSYAAAVRLGVHVKGTAPVEVRALLPTGDDRREPPPTRLVTAPDEAAPAWVQVGSFASRENAERLAQQLRAALAEPVRVDEVAVGVSHMFRVRLGPFLRAAEALDLSGRVSAAGFGNPRILTE